ncbi:MAG: CPBP family intramembrane metalloprotease [Lachnospiraceae bacterium]|nr:CPBP family intramembrane metalloprotease [Lachnospiraceae bacterium]
MAELEEIYEDNSINQNTVADSEIIEEEYFDEAEKKRQRRRYFSSAMWKLTLSLVILLVIQVVTALPIGLTTLVLDKLSENSTSGFLSVFRTLYDLGYVETFNNILSLFVIIFPDCIGLLVFILLTKNTKNAELDNQKLSFGLWFAMFIMCFGIGGIGTVLGLIANAIIKVPAGVLGLLLKSIATIGTITSGGGASLTNADDSLIYILIEIPIAAILVPIVEEYTFRKVLIDKTARYGYGPAILLSGLTFGIIHGNFSQFFYAMGLGFLFAYIYCVTGKVRYSIFMHMGYNFYAAAILPLARKMIPAQVKETVQAALDQLSVDGDIYKYSDTFSDAILNNPISIVGMFAVTAVILFYFVLIISGIILMIVFLRKFLHFRKTLPLGEKGIKRCAIFNVGSILYLCLGIVIFGLTITVDFFSTLYSVAIL